MTATAARAFERYIRGELAKLEHASKKRHEHAADVHDRAHRDPGRWGRLSAILSDDSNTYQRETAEREKLAALRALVPLVRSGAMTVAEALQSAGKSNQHIVTETGRTSGRAQSAADRLAAAVDDALDRLNNERELLHDCVDDLRQLLTEARGSFGQELGALAEEVRLVIENADAPLPDHELRDHVGAQVERLQQALSPTRKLRFGRARRKETGGP